MASDLARERINLQRALDIATNQLAEANHVLSRHIATMPVNGSRKTDAVYGRLSKLRDLRRTQHQAAFARLHRFDAEIAGKPFLRKIEGGRR